MISTIFFLALIIPLKAQTICELYHPGLPKPHQPYSISTPGDFKEYFLNMRNPAPDLSLSLGIWFRRTGTRGPVDDVIILITDGSLEYIKIFIKNDQTLGWAISDGASWTFHNQPGVTINLNEWNFFHHAQHFFLTQTYTLLYFTSSDVFVAYVNYIGAFVSGFQFGSGLFVRYGNLPVTVPSPAECEIGLMYFVNNNMVNLAEIKRAMGGQSYYKNNIQVLIFFEDIVGTGYKDWTGLQRTSYTETTLKSDQYGSYSIFNGTNFAQTGFVPINDPGSGLFFTIGLSFKFIFAFAADNSYIFKLVGTNSLKTRFSMRLKGSFFRFESDNGYVDILVSILVTSSSFQRLLIAYNSMFNSGFLWLRTDLYHIYSGYLTGVGVTPIFDSSYRVLFGSQDTNTLGFNGSLNYFSIQEGFYILDNLDNCGIYAAHCKIPLNESFCFVCQNAEYSFNLTSGNCELNIPKPSFPNNFWVMNFDCPSGYIRATDGVCKDCIVENCEKCSGYSNCTKCLDGYYFKETSCVELICHFTCLKCNTPSPSDCISCNFPYKFLNGQCIERCPAGTIMDSTQSCKACPFGCSTCIWTNSGASCTKCNPGMNLFAGLCYTTCPDHYYLDSLIKTCEPCNSECYSCYGSANTQCPICTSTAWSQGVDTCVSSCSSNYLPSFSDRKCKPCHSSCSKCSGFNDNDCITCSSPTQYPDNGKCTDCNSACFSCKGPSDKDCTSCWNGYILKSGKCESIECPDGYYGDSATGTCKKCPEGCKRCKSQTFCTECELSHILDATSCIPCEKFKGYKLMNDYCGEICGDGLKMSFNQCDDGNNIDDDGCSSVCIIEDGWYCKGGSRTSKDTCDLISKVKIIIGRKTDNGVGIWLNFSDPVTVLESWENTINIFEMPRFSKVESYKISSKDNKNFFIDLSSLKYLYLTKTFQVAIKKPKNLIDGLGNPIYFEKKQILVKFPDDNENNSGAFETAGLIIGGLTLTSMAVSGGASIMFKILGSLQTLTYISLLSVDYRELLDDLLTITKFARFAFFPNFFELIGKGVLGDLPEGTRLPEKFGKKGISSFFFLNSGSTLTFIFLMMIAKFFFEKFLVKKNFPLKKYILNCFSSETIAKVYQTSFLPLFVGATLQMISLNFENGFSSVSSILGILVFSLLLASPFVLSCIFMNSSTLKGNDLEELKSKYIGFLQEFNPNNFITRNFAIFLLLEKITFSFGLVFLCKMPKLQLFGTLTAKLALSAVMMQSRPYKNTTDNRGYTTLESVTALTVLSITLMYFIGEEGFFYFSSVFFVIGMLTINLGIAGHQQYYALKEFYFKLRKKKNGKIEKIKTYKHQTEAKLEIRIIKKRQMFNKTPYQQKRDDLERQNSSNSQIRKLIPLKLKNSRRDF